MTFVNKVEEMGMDAEAIELFSKFISKSTCTRRSANSMVSISRLICQACTLMSSGFCNFVGKDNPTDNPTQCKRGLPFDPPRRVKLPQCLFNESLVVRVKTQSYFMNFLLSTRSLVLTYILLVVCHLS